VSVIKTIAIVAVVAFFLIGVWAIFGVIDENVRKRR